ncbi:MAG: Epimerase family protein [Syntrophorhabdus sp. PtaU1.Bin153]|nr:MAG: Epimerase family protein [Syntrophorhabdus sp. PtaU1.Bin153]
MKIFLAGGTGFLGQYLCRFLTRRGHEITLLIRSPVGKMDGRARIVRGDPTQRGQWQDVCGDHEVVINLTGASIFQPWTRKTKKAIHESRILSTDNIVEAIRNVRDREVHLFNASGVGYYGYSTGALFDEDGLPGDTFLARLANLWEERALRAQESGARVVLCRFGIVLGEGGGAFQRMVPLVRFHLGVPWGAGDQWFSWIHERDVAEIFSFLLDDKSITGPVNFAAPMPIRNREMMATLNKVFHKRPFPFIPSIPRWLFAGLLGEFSTVFLEGQRVIPRVLTTKGFQFTYRTFEEAAADLIRSK